jgi:3,4-dihydroxy 2-butanone 4-phosphate synthase/GTP cyclohydrolase II
VFPVKTCPGGTLQQPAVPEAAVDLARLAGLAPAAATCEILDESGTIAGLTELTRFCRRHHLKLLRLTELTEFRLRHDRLVEQLASTDLRCRSNVELRAMVYRSRADGSYQLAIAGGGLAGGHDVPVRVFEESLAIVNGVAKPLLRGIDLIENGGTGVIVGLLERTDGPELIRRLEQGMGWAIASRPASEATGSAYLAAAQILIDLGVASARIQTDHPTRIAEMLPHLLRVNHEVSIQALDTRGVAPTRAVA